MRTNVNSFSGHDKIEKFRDFMRVEFSDELLDFWLEVEDFKHMAKTPGFPRMAKRICSTYISYSSPREVRDHVCMITKACRMVTDEMTIIFFKAFKFLLQKRKLLRRCSYC